MNSSMISSVESLGQASAISVTGAPVRRLATVSLTLKCRATDIGRITRPAPEATTCMAISGPPSSATSRNVSCGQVLQGHFLKHRNLVPLGRHHHGLLLVQGDHVEAFALHRKPDEAEVRGTVAQYGQLRAVVGHKRLQRNVQHRSSQRRIHFPGVTPAT